MILSIYIQLAFPMRRFKIKVRDQNITSAAYIANIVVSIDGISVILTHAAKEKDAESVGIEDEMSVSGIVRNCPDVKVTNEF